MVKLKVNKLEMHVLLPVRGLSTSYVQRACTVLSERGSETLGAIIKPTMVAKVSLNGSLLCFLHLDYAIVQIGTL